MKFLSFVSLLSLTAIALLGSQPEYAFAQSSDATLAKTEPSSQQGFSVNNMDKSVSPKDNFYHFAAGNWLKKAVIADNKNRVDSFTEFFFNQNSLKIQKIMEDSAAKSSKAPKGSVIQQVGDFYASGMNTALINKLGITPVKPKLAKIDALSSKEDLITPIAA